ncbi:MAG TPA: DUF4214 domain-containing protein, partial [Iamia sp.]|nr:DUF4214 domain-containing protein [Iamia sp.]
ALQTSENHLATEADVIASSSYFALADNDPEEYVRSLYWDILGREGSTVDVDYWEGRIVNAIQTRRQVSVAFLRSSEAALFRVNGFSWEPGCPTTDLIRFDNIESGSYCLVLNRKGSVADANYWASTYTGGGQLVGIWTALAVSTEYYNLAQV